MRSEFKDDYLLIGRNIAKYRKLKGIRQKDLAECLNVETSYIGQIEAPNLYKSFSLDKLFMIADALEVPVYKLLLPLVDEEEHI